MDFPGNLDTSLQVSDAVIAEQVKAYVAECLSDSFEFLGFIVTVSLEEEVNHHLSDINRLTQVFGTGI